MKHMADAELVNSKNIIHLAHSGYIEANNIENFRYLEENKKKRESSKWERMKYQQFGTSFCFFVALLHCPIQLSGVQAQGVRKECPCWQKLAEGIREQLQTETDERQANSLWLNGPIYNLLPFDDGDSLSSSVSQPEVDLQRDGQTALGKLLLRRAARSGQYRESSYHGIHCNVCWAILQDLSNPLKTPRSADTYDFGFGGISKKAMLNNGW
ncbi:hypothetical protein RRG08_035558 [Elysia crispata]|uniref:Uncharacterized protein n=1 Tax=Elysia crispata TaxID=231223 RepID=A0AAE1E9Z1_9GAST|nr:hypothetical protein RRG08_035558 [Elysia crispata]